MTGLMTIVVILLLTLLNSLAVVLKLPQGRAVARLVSVPGMLGELGRLRATMLELVPIRKVLLRLRQ